MKKSVRLSAYVKPERYQLFIKPDLEHFTFYGEEVIFLNFKKTVSEITLHAKELEIEEAKLGGQKLKIKYDQKSETVTFIPKNKVPKGRGELHIKYRGILNDKMRGFYRSKYFIDGKERYMATTQFESTDARRAFPCVDEPAAKAVFDVTLMVPAHTVAISNTIEIEIAEHESGYKVVKFAPTPKMSTYLLAFIVGEFEYIEGKSGRGVLIRVFVTPGKKHQAKFALGCAIKVLDFYEKYFDIKYPLPVLDLIAIPDFSAGAMENWGAVTYRETALLVDPEHSSAANKQWVALVIAHELAHQWFGNLVTMEWWTHLWLNEGFASYIEYLAVNELFPSWDIWTQFAYADLGVALKLDALKNTHPIEVRVNHPEEIGEIFDEVSYSKGGSVIRMLANYLGERNFRDGLRYYLKKHAYGNAETRHLWQAFEKVSKKPVSKIMQNWTAKPGYPVLRLIEEKNKLKIEQKRFFSSPLSKKSAVDNTVWQVPVQVQSEKLKTQSFLLTQKQLVISKPKKGWIKMNAGEAGFYRTDYPAQMLSALKGPIKSKKLSPIDRLGIVRDAFALAESGDCPTVQALELALGYTEEDDYTVWVELASGLGTLDSLFFGQAFYRSYENLAQKVFEKIGAKLGWKPKANEKHTATLLRNLALYNLGSFGHKPTIERAKKLFWGKQPISADIRGLVYSLAAQNGGAREFNELKNKYVKEEMHEEKNRIGRALAAFRDKNLLNKTLEFALSEHVRFQDAPSLLAGVWVNNYGKDVAWNFVKKNWKTLVERYGSGGYTLGRILKAGGYMNNENQARDFEKFFKIHKAPGAERAIQQVLERIRSNVLWLKKDGRHIHRFLETNT